MPEEMKITLSSVARGGAEELFQRDLQKVLADIQDVNVPATAKRSITVKIDFVPNEERDVTKLDVKVSHTLPGSKGTEAIIYTPDRKTNGKYVVHEHNPQQMRIMDVTNKPVEPAEGPKGA